MRALADRRRIGLALAATLSLTLAVCGLAAAAMQSTKLERGLCETTGGGRFVDIPKFPGEMIDRRLLRDVRMLARRYKIFVTDGYAMSGHAENGEHPVGLALDIVPNKAKGGRWSDIDRLARWAEPRQGRPRAPFRWVGYDGDAGHGRGHHLHLSWSHSETRPGRPARTVYSVRCPQAKPKPGDGTEIGGGELEGDGPLEGGTEVGDIEVGGPSGSGGIGSSARVKLAPVVAETGE